MISLSLTACPGGGSSSSTTASTPTTSSTPTYTVGGTITGLASGASYAVTVGTPPTGQSCAVVKSTGTVASAAITNVAVNCITPGQVSTFAGSLTSGSADGTGSVASFSNPYSVAVDASGNVYVADWGNNEIGKITPASFYYPANVAVDVSSGNLYLYVADQTNNEIRLVTP